MAKKESQDVGCLDRGGTGEGRRERIRSYLLFWHEQKMDKKACFEGKGYFHPIFEILAIEFIKF